MRAHGWLAPAIGLLTWAALPRLAAADTMDPALGRFVLDSSCQAPGPDGTGKYYNPNSGFTKCLTDDAQFARLIAQYGFALAPTAMHSARTTGFGGFEIATAQEINGLTLGGVGSGTEIDHVEVLHNKDDAFEFFGGTVNASHLLGIAFADDGLDFDFGYGGSIQFAAMIKRPEADEADSNILTESDNNASGGADEPVTNPNVYNVTAIRVASNVGFYGGRIRRNSRGHYGNIIVSGSKNAPIFIDGSAAQGNATSGLLVLDHSILHGSFETAAYPNTSGAPTRDYLFTTRKYNRNADPQLAIGTPTSLKTLLPDLTPLAGSPALDAGFVANPPDNGFLKAVPYQGAVGPGDNWVLSGWATFSDN